MISTYKYNNVLITRSDNIRNVITQTTDNNILNLYYSRHRLACNEFYIKFENENVIKNKCIIILHYIIQPIHDSLFELLLLSQKCKVLGAKSIKIFIPYLYYSRHDKNDNPNLQALLSMLKAVGVNNIISIDIHSQYDFNTIKVHNISLSSFFAQQIMQIYTTDKLQELIIVSPDHGGQDRAKSVAQLLGGIRTICLSKKRNMSQIIYCDLPNNSNLLGKQAIIIDDIIDSGDTLLSAAQTLHSVGAASVDAFITHAVLSDNAALRVHQCILINQVYITNTIVHTTLPSKFHTIDITKFIADAVVQLITETDV